MHDAAYLHPSANIPTKYQLPTKKGKTSYNLQFLTYSQDKIFSLCLIAQLDAIGANNTA